MRSNENWSETYDHLSRADLDQSLAPKNLEKLALAAYLTGRDTESSQILERAHHEFLGLDQKLEAVRCAFWLGMIYMDAREKARGGGWLARGERILSEIPDSKCAERGLFLIPKALGVFYSGRADQAQKLFEQASSIGEQFGDVDLIAFGRLGQSQAMIQQGRLTEGIKLLDETMIFAGTEEIFPVCKGIIYCAGIETCRKVWELERAQEWTSALNHWFEKQQDIVPFRGQCLVSRAEISQFHGDWQGALREADMACELLTRPPGRSAAGSAYYRKAELHRLMGNVAEAEIAYREASKWGRSPQPGMALLRLSQGQEEAAKASIKNTLDETSEKLKRAELLPAYVQIMVSVNQEGEALEACIEYNNFASQFDTPYLQALAAYCQGTVFLANDNYPDARESMRKSQKIWSTMNLPYESAQTREMKGYIYRKLGDSLNANIELSVAKWLYEQLGAEFDLHRINRMLHENTDIDHHGLTLREIQVLQRVAAGQTNKTIAGELFISERTVDRHVSNIFNKLCVSSRVEATTYAIRNKIIDIEF